MAFGKIMNFEPEEREKKNIISCLERAVNQDFFEIAFAHKSFTRELKWDHPRFRFMVVLEGEFNYRIQATTGIKIVKLTPGKAMFCQQRGATELPDQTEISPCVMLTFVFWPEYVRFLITKRTPNDEEWQHFLYHSSHSIDQFGLYILKALDELAILGDSDVRASFLAKALLYTCRDNLLNDNPKKRSKSFYVHQNIKAYMHENSNININRASVAETFKLTPSHISRLFTTYDEYNFSTVLKKMRLEHAVELLKDTTFSIDKITEQCGFGDTSYFIKTFRLFYGCPPGNFRKRKNVITESQVPK